MSEHTPGPWRVATEMDGRHRAISILTAAPEFVVDGEEPYHPLIAAAYHGWGSAPRDVAEANARLIAAAPEMLEALRSASIAVAELCEGQDKANQCWVILNEIHAAIAKATGEKK